MPGLSELRPPSSQWLQLQELANRFEKTWLHAESSVRDVDLQPFLPPPADPLHLPALHLLLKVDLEVRWRRGQTASLESYLARFPELGSAATLPVELIVQEYHVRHRFGDRPAPESYRARFPEQFPHLLPLLQPPDNLTPATVAGPPPPSSTPSDSPPTVLAPASEPAISAKPSPPSFVPSSPARAADVLSVGGGYRMVKKLGSGTFGEVWKAEGPGGTEAAIKIISRPIDQREAQQELQALEHVKRLRHPYLVQTQAYWILDNRLYIVMDLADGSLADRAEECLARGLPGIPPDELVGYLTEAAEALDYLRSQGIHHRDIKPGNILLLQGYARLADFGLARTMESQGSLLDATAAGTPSYMAPEVWRGKVSPYSDQWSLAATFAELRLNRRLFQAGDLLGLMREICQGGPPDLTGVDEREQAVLRKALAASPADRYPSCKEFALALQDARRALPAPPPAPPPAPGKPRLLWAAVLLLTCLVSLGVLAAFVLPSLLAPSSPPAREVEAPTVVPSPPPPSPRIVLTEPPPLLVVTGRETTLSLGVQRSHFAGPIRVSGAGKLPYGLSVRQEKLDGGEKITVQVAAAPDAVLGGASIFLRAEGINAGGEVGPTAQTVVQVTVLFLPPGFEKNGETIIEDGKGVKYYERIACVVEGMRVPFVLVPQRSKQERLKRKQDPDTFYIMQDKVSLALFRAFARRHLEAVKGREWDKPKGDPRRPVFDVTVDDAYTFASVGLKGNLPTVEQWDKAAGRYEEPRPWEGPYIGKWTDARKDVAVNRDKPLPLDQALGDESLPFHCRNMAGNGFEWTRTVTGGKPIPLKNSTLDDQVSLRGWSFTGERPLTYEDLETGPAMSLPYRKTRADVTFRVVIEP